MAVAELNDIETKKKKLIKKKRKIRAKRRFIVLLFLLVCVGTIFVVLKAPFFNVKTIVCVGQTSLPEEEVIKIAGAKTDVNIFSTGVGTMKRRLAAHPGIAECNVRRLFPNKIKIWVRESKAVICIEQGVVFLLADKDGRIIKSVDAKNEDAAKGIARLAEFKPQSTAVGECIFSKEDATHNVLRECVGVLDSLDMIGDVTMIDGKDLSDIKIEYQDRLTILLGSYENAEYKLTFVKKVINEELSKYEKATLDYRGSKLYVGPRTEELPTVDTEEKAEGQGEDTDKPAEGEKSGEQVQSTATSGDKEV